MQKMEAGQLPILPKSDATTCRVGAQGLDFINPAGNE
jgi:hypothetical protein